MNIDIKDIFYLGLQDDDLTILTISGDNYKTKLKDFLKTTLPTLDYDKHKAEVMDMLGDIQREADKKLKKIYGEYFILRETSSIDIRESLKAELSQVLRDSLNNI
jgi:hypothetical protein